MQLINAYLDSGAVAQFVVAEARTIEVDGQSGVEFTAPPGDSYQRLLWSREDFAEHVILFTAQALPHDYQGS